MDDTNVQMAASSWLDVGALALFALASMVTMGIKADNYDTYR